MTLGDEVNVFQPPGQVVDVLEPELVIDGEIVAVNGREEIGNGRTQAVLVEHSDIGQPGDVIREEFGVALTQRQINAQAVYLQRGHGRFGAAVVTVLQVVNQVRYPKKMRFILPEWVSSLPEVCQ